MKSFIKMMALIIILCACSKEAAEKNKTEHVYAHKVSLSIYEDERVYPAEIVERYERNLAFQVSGKVISKNVEVGDSIKKNDILARIDSKDIDETVNIALAGLNQANNRFALSKSTYERQKTLYENNVISESAYDRYLSQYKDAESDVKHAKAQYTQSRNMQEYTVLKADYKGVVTSVNIEAGQIISAGMPVITLAQTDELEAEFYIPENTVNNTYAGQAVTVRFWSYPDLECKGVIREIAPVADKLSRTFKAKAEIKNPPAELKGGMSANVSVLYGQNPGVFIPVKSVYYSGNKSNVWVIKENRVFIKEVEIAGFNNDFVKIKSGISEGDIIVASGAHKLLDGQAVIVHGESDE